MRPIVVAFTTGTEPVTGFRHRRPIFFGDLWDEPLIRFRGTGKAWNPRSGRMRTPPPRSRRCCHGEREPEGCRSIRLRWVAWRSTPAAATAAGSPEHGSVAAAGVDSPVERERLSGQGTASL